MKTENIIEIIQKEDIPLIPLHLLLWQIDYKSDSSRDFIFKKCVSLKFNTQNYRVNNIFKPIDK